MRTDPNIRRSFAPHLFMIVWLVACAWPATAQAAEETPRKAKRSADTYMEYTRASRKFADVRRSRPRRVDGPLREENISDIEVEQVVRATHEIYPGAIVNIGGVTAPCPCEDGPACESQVWVIANESGRSNGLMLSEINGTWTIGPLQRWWLSFDELRIRERTTGRFSEQALRARTDLYDRFPFCVTPP